MDGLGAQEETVLFGLVLVGQTMSVRARNPRSLRAMETTWKLVTTWQEQATENEARERGGLENKITHIWGIQRCIKAEFLAQKKESRVGKFA